MYLSYVLLITPKRKKSLTFPSMIALYIDFFADMCYNRYDKWSPNTLIDGLYQLLKSKIFTDLVHHGMLVLHERMHITVQRYRCILMTERFRQCLYIHPAFDRSRGKCVPECMEATARDSKILQQQFKAPLI